MDQINLRFLFYGYSAAWLIVIAYVILLVRRGQKMDKELTRLKNLVDERKN